MKKKIVLMAALMLAITQTNQAFFEINNPLENWSTNEKIDAACVGAAVVGAGCYWLYNAYNTYVENKIINTSVEYLTSALTSQTTIDKMDETQKEKVLRDKAWLIGLRKRVLTKLSAKVDSDELSLAHRQALQANTNMLNTFFGIVDAQQYGEQNTNMVEFLITSAQTMNDTLPEGNPYKAKLMQAINALNNPITKTVAKLTTTLAPNVTAQVQAEAKAFMQSLTINNPYIAEYETASFTDQIIEDKLVASCILKYKPDAECSPSEKAQKRALEQRRNRILERLPIDQICAQNIITHAAGNIIGTAASLSAVTNGISTLSYIGMLTLLLSCL